MCEALGSRICRTYHAEKQCHPRRQVFAPLLMRLRTASCVHGACALSLTTSMQPCRTDLTHEITHARKEISLSIQYSMLTTQIVCKGEHAPLKRWSHNVRYGQRIVRTFSDFESVNTGSMYR